MIVQFFACVSLKLCEQTQRGPLGYDHSVLKLRYMLFLDSLRESARSMRYLLAELNIETRTIASVSQAVSKDKLIDVWKNAHEKRKL